jgi:hypothetical protein
VARNEPAAAHGAAIAAAGTLRFRRGSAHPKATVVDGSGVHGIAFIEWTDGAMEDLLVRAGFAEVHSVRKPEPGEDLTDAGCRVERIRRAARPTAVHKLN